MKHKFKISDATKDELIQYFFGIDTFGGGYRVPADKDRFLIWLENKRTEDLIAAEAEANEASCDALDEYIAYVKQANEESDLGKKLQLFGKADKAYRRYKRLSKQGEEIGAKVHEALGMG